MKPVLSDVSVITGSNPEMIFGCLDSFIKYAPVGYSFRFNVIINSPGGDIVRKIRARYDVSDWRIIENSRQLGFAENHNMILGDSIADYVFILNDDLLFLPGSIEKMLVFMEKPENGRVAMLSPRLLNPDGSMQPCTYSFAGISRAFLSVSGLRELLPFSGVMNRCAAMLGLGGGKSRFWAHDRTADVDTFRGACVLSRMAAVREIGLMHTESRAGGEESEWHYRFKKQGWRIVFYHEAEVVHYGSQTVSTMPSARNEALKSYLHFFKTHRPVREFYAYVAMMFAAFSVKWAWHFVSLRRKRMAEDAAGMAIIRKKLSEGARHG